MITSSVPAASMYLRNALVLSLALHAATAWLLSHGHRYADMDAPTLADAKKALSVSFHAVTPIATIKIEAPREKATPTPPEETYFASSEVEESAKPLEIKPLIIPQRAYLERTKGKVRLRAYIDQAGKVDHVDILAAEPPGIYEHQAVVAVTGSTFTPARLHGLPVKAFKDIEIAVDPYETIAVP